MAAERRIERATAGRGERSAPQIAADTIWRAAMATMARRAARSSVAFYLPHFYLMNDTRVEGESD